MTKRQTDNLEIKMKPAIDDLHVPMVQVNEDFDQLVSWKASPNCQCYPLPLPPTKYIPSANMFL